MGIVIRRASGLALVAILGWITVGAAQTGGPFNLKRNTIAAGGATSSSAGTFRLGGTIAQPNAAISSGGPFTLQSGFWAGFVATLLDVAPAPAEFPKAFRLLAAAPNPFATATVVSFELPRRSGVRLAIYDLQGHRVRSLVDQPLAPGIHHVPWDGRDAALAAAPAGVYFASLDADAFHASTRIVLLH